MTVQATDRDIGINAELEYTLENYRDLFSLDKNSGELKTKKSLDREEQEYYFLNVVVYDKGLCDSLDFHFVATHAMVSTILLGPSSLGPSSAKKLFKDLCLGS